MDYFRKKKLGERTVSAAIVLVVVIAGLSLIWRGTGQSLIRLQMDIQNRREDIKQLRDEILVSRRLFLEGEAADRIRTQFEQHATPAQYFGEVVGELRRREMTDRLRLRRVALEPPEQAGEVTRVRFTLELEAPFGAMASFMEYLEEAFPAYQVNQFVLARADGERTVSGTLSGSLFMPQ